MSFISTNKISRNTGKKIGISIILLFWSFLALNSQLKSIKQVFYFSPQLHISTDSKRKFLLDASYSMLQKTKNLLPDNAVIFLTGTRNPEHYFWAVYYLYPRRVYINEISEKVIGDFHKPEEFLQNINKAWLTKSGFTHVLNLNTEQITPVDNFQTGTK